MFVKNPYFAKLFKPVIMEKCASFSMQSQEPRRHIRSDIFPSHSLFKLLVIGVFALTLVGCAQVVRLPELSGVEPAGFLSGWWHGFIMLWSFIGSMFNDNIAIYAVYNNGGWYDFGFLLGLGMFGGGARQSYSSSRRNSYE
jgi:hypothetical protein